MKGKVCYLKGLSNYPGISILSTFIERILVNAHYVAAWLQKILVNTTLAHIFASTAMRTLRSSLLLVAGNVTS